MGTALGTLGFPLIVRSQPTTVRLVVGFPPGGTADFYARAIAPALGRELGQSVIVENKAGAGGLIAGEMVSRAAPDMTTLWLTSVGAVAIAPTLAAKPPFDPLRDITPVALLASNVEVLVVNANSPFNSVDELVAAARKGRKMIFASSGNGGVPHLAIELLNAGANLDILHVPYKGGGPAANAIMGGEVDGYFSDIAPALGLIRGGKLKPIGLAGARRHAILPQVKTIDEMGVKGVVADNWVGLFAPKGSAASDVSRVAQALRTALLSPQLRATLEQSGAEVTPSTPNELATLLERDHAKWGALIKAKNIQAG